MKKNERTNELLARRLKQCAQLQLAASQASLARSLCAARVQLEAGTCGVLEFGARALLERRAARPLEQVFALSLAPGKVQPVSESLMWPPPPPPVKLAGQNAALRSESEFEERFIEASSERRNVFFLSWKATKSRRAAPRLERATRAHFRLLACLLLTFENRKV